MSKTPSGCPPRSSVARPTHLSFSPNDAIPPSWTSLSAEGLSQPVFGPDTGQEAAGIAYTEADDSSARSVSCLVRKTRNDETFSKRVRPAERPNPHPGDKTCAAASWVLRRRSSAVSWPAASQNGHSARRSTPQRPKRTVQTPYRIHPSPARGHLATSR